MNKPLLSLVTAMDSNRLIGKDNSLPWHLPADLVFFKRTTMGKPIILGRQSVHSIGAALPGRQNIVVTRDCNFNAPNCEAVQSIDQAINLSTGAEEVMLIGGASLYEQTINKADIIYLTLIHHEFDGDAWFPEIDPADWKLTSQNDYDANEKNPFSYSFLKLVREI